MKEYIIHGTQPENLIKILENGFIDNNPTNPTMIKKKIKQIFTQLVYYDIKGQEGQKPHWFSCAIVLDKKILKDFPFYANDIGRFQDKFENGKTAEGTVIYGDGNLTRMPNLTKLKKRINGSFDFMHTHEILFNKKIPLDKYCLKIIIYLSKDEFKKSKLFNKYTNRIIELAKENNIPLKFRDYKNGKNDKVINNFIDSIENTF
jgi:hypothetical protein